MMMITYQELLSLLFRCINSGVVIGLGVYAYKKYLAPQLVQAYQQERDEVENAETTLAKLLLAQKQEVDALHSDQERFQQLRTKIDQWHTTCVQKKQQAVADREKRMADINQARIKQREQLARAQLTKRVGPAIIAQVRTDLVRAVADAQQAHGLIERIMRNMKQEAAHD